MGCPLSGLRILEVGHMLAGPYSGMLLADLGAEVIKIEHGKGDVARSVGSGHVGPHNLYFSSLNRNKKSVQLSLDTDEGQQALGRLAGMSDALIVNLKPSVIKRLGLTYDALRKWNDRLVCVAVTGFGLDHDQQDQPAFDYVIQALTGIAEMTGDPDGAPTLPGYSAVDNSAGIMAALGLLAQLQSGRGGQVDVALYDVMLSQLNYKATACLNGSASPSRFPNGAHSYFVPAQIFETRDGHLALFVSHDEFWRRLAAAVGHPEWTDDPRMATADARFTHREFVVDEVAAVLRSETTARWEKLLLAGSVPAGGVRCLSDALDSDLTRQREMVTVIETEHGPLRLIGNPIKIGTSPELPDLPPPSLGEHAGALLNDV